MEIPPNTLVSRLKFSAFTLIELLVVMSIIALLLALVVPVTSGISKANQVSMGIQTVVDTLSTARLTALSQNRVVEVRFYKYTDTQRLSPESEVASMQAFIYDETNTVAKPVGEIQNLPNGAVISNSDEYSSLMKATRAKNFSSDDPKTRVPRAGGTGVDYEAYRLRFRPDGSTDLGSGQWFLTIHGTNETEDLPANHAVIHIDAYNGSLRLYRPG